MSFSPDSSSSRSTERLVYRSKLPSRTQTSFASECDINVIVGRFLKTGLLPSSPRTPVFGDATALPIGTDALMAVRVAQQSFELLPLAVRRLLDHDPRQLESWLSDPSNLDLAIQHGLVSRRASSASSSAEVPAPPVAKSAPPASKVPPVDTTPEKV